MSEGTQTASTPLPRLTPRRPRARLIELPQPQQPSTAVSTATRAQRSSARWVIAFLLLQFICQLALLVPALTPLRIGFRVASFGMSLAMLVLPPGRRGAHRHPALVAAMCVMAILLVQFMNPEAPNFLASLATTVMNLAILAPVVWASRLRLDARSFRAVVVTLWLLQSASAFVGVLQTRYPARFPSAVSAVLSESDYGVEGARFVMANGEEILRPSGLTDQPGGAGVA